MPITDFFADTFRLQSHDGTQDRAGQRLEAGWSDSFTAEPCRLIDRGSAPSVIRQAQQRQYRYILMCGTDLAVTPDVVDRVYVTTGGQELGPFTVDEVMLRRDKSQERFYTLRLELVDG